MLRERRGSSGYETRKTRCPTRGSVLCEPQGREHEAQHSARLKEGGWSEIAMLWRARLDVHGLRSSCIRQADVAESTPHPRFFRGSFFSSLSADLKRARDHPLHRDDTTASKWSRASNRHLLGVDVHAVPHNHRSGATLIGIRRYPYRCYYPARRSNARRALLLAFCWIPTASSVVLLVRAKY